MSIDETREKYPTMIALYTRKVLNGELTMEQVPALLRPVVEEDVANQDALIEVYVAQLLGNKIFFSQVPIILQDQVQAILDSMNGPTNLNIYVADMLDGKITSEDLPEAIRAEVIAEVEQHIGKKLEADG